jgi:S1-C subfamily serine protease
MRRFAVASVLLLAAVAAAVAWFDPEAEPVSTEDAPSARPRAIQVVSVAARAGGQTPEVATGFTVRRGLVVTVAHLVDDGQTLSLRAGSRPARRARVLAVDRDADLALLAAPALETAADGEGTARTSRDSPHAAGPARVTGRSTPPAETGSLLVLRDGAVIARPAPVRREIDAHVEDPGGGQIRRRPALELAASVSAGDSGAPVLTADGELAGVLFARSRSRPRTAYAVDVSAVTRLLRAGDPAGPR